MESGSEPGKSERPKQRRPLKRTPLNRLGKRGRVRNREGIQAAANAAAKSGGRCEFPHMQAAYLHRLAVPCTGNQGVDPHHRTLRSAGPSRIGDVDNIVMVCRSAHDAIHANPAVARQLGFYNP